MTILLETSDLGFRYPNGPWLFRGVNLSLMAGQITLLTGPSGSGKTSLLYALCGLIPQVFAGEYIGKTVIKNLDSRQWALPRLASVLAVVFQTPQLFFPRLEDELAFTPENLQWSRQRMTRAVEEALAAAKLEPFRDKAPERLSGGQQQLASWATALTAMPDIFLLDEPFSQLDPAGKQLLRDSIQALAAAGKAIFLIEHSDPGLDNLNNLCSLDKGVLTRRVHHKIWG
ncbi:MAG: energy-coupling factor ABC transporter ATP-binding protein [Clostridiales bacterium]|jgi:energy-coupling factor transport system ATP-binding protein|nr:energy-coupling factor ABC transporter ATP-binding protein [Clostridiales bacterium]MDR2713430.1 energy-coupling factor ABC transporter ATP-binding protein [Clostridiales bacterium]